MEASNFHYSHLFFQKTQITSEQIIMANSYSDFQGARLVPIFVLCQHAVHLSQTCTFKKNPIGCETLDLQNSFSNCELSHDLYDRVRIRWNGDRRLVSLHTIFWVNHNKEHPPVGTQQLHVCHGDCWNHTLNGCKIFCSFLPLIGAKVSLFIHFYSTLG